MPLLAAAAAAAAAADPAWRDDDRDFSFFFFFLICATVFYFFLYLFFYLPYNLGFLAYPTSVYTRAPILPTPPSPFVPCTRPQWVSGPPSARTRRPGTSQSEPPPWTNPLEKRVPTCFCRLCPHSHSATISGLCAASFLLSWRPLNWASAGRRHDTTQNGHKSGNPGLHIRGDGDIARQDSSSCSWVPWVADSENVGREPLRGPFHLLAVPTSGSRVPLSSDSDDRLMGPGLAVPKSHWLGCCQRWTNTKSTAPSVGRPSAMKSLLSSVSEITHLTSHTVVPLHLIWVQVVWPFWLLWVSPAAVTKSATSQELEGRAAKTPSPSVSQEPPVQRSQHHATGPELS